MSDLISLLGKFPPNTAGALYLGFLSSMYLTRSSNLSRIPPSSPVTRHLLELQSSAFTTNAILSVAKRLADNPDVPLYLPRNTPVTVSAVFDIEPHASTRNRLRSLKVEGIELLQVAQNNMELNLRSIFGGVDLVQGKEVVKQACDLFAIPFAQIKQTELLEDQFTLTETIGFKNPRDVVLPQEQNNAQ